MSTKAKETQIVAGIARWKRIAEFCVVALIVYILTMPPIYLAIDQHFGPVATNQLAAVLYFNPLISFFYEEDGILGGYFEWWRQRFY